jgi:hypothetical protein
MRTQSYQEVVGREACVSSPRPRAVTKDLSRCDWAIVRTLERVGLATSLQLERLHFHAVPEKQRGITCRDTLQRLVELRVLATCNPSISDSSGDLPVPTYSLGRAGSRLVQASASTQAAQTEEGDDQRFARTLAITDLFVDLVELDRAGDLSLEAFRAGRASQWPDGLGGTLDPEAFIRVARGDTADFWWLVADEELESTARILAKAQTYRDFLRRKEPGPDGVTPGVMIGTLNPERTEALRFMLGGLAEPERQMFTVTALSDAAKLIQQNLRVR